MIRHESMRVRRRLGAAWTSSLALVSPLLFAQAPPPSGFPGTPPKGPDALILNFEVEPETIDPGQSARLRWSGVNAYSVTIDPELGAVPIRGTRSVSPAATTTYTLTMTGPAGAKSASLTVRVSGTVPRAASNDGSEQLPVPRLVDGKPDLSGVYLGGRDIGLSSGITLLPGAESFRLEQRDDDLGLGALCLPPGVPAATLVPYPFQIVHKPDVMVILYEAYNLFRIIPIGIPHPEDLDLTWMGHSVASWDGDTLVVDVTGFNDRTRVAGHRHTDAMHVVERYTRSAYGRIEYRATVEDPNVFAEPLVYTGDLVLHPEWEIGEYVCAENNKDYTELF